MKKISMFFQVLHNILYLPIRARVLCKLKVFSLWCELQKQIFKHGVNSTKLLGFKSHQNCCNINFGQINFKGWTPDHKIH